MNIDELRAKLYDFGGVTEVQVWDKSKDVEADIVDVHFDPTESPAVYLVVNNDIG